MICPTNMDEGENRLYKSRKEVNEKCSYREENETKATASGRDLNEPPSLFANELREISQRTCSRALHTLLPNPTSLRCLSKIIIGVSGPFPSLDLARVELPPPPDRKAIPPRITKVSLAFSRAFSLVSPRRSITPPAGRKAMRTWRRVYASTEEEGEAEDVEAAGDGMEDVT